MKGIIQRQGIEATLMMDADPLTKQLVLSVLIPELRDENHKRSDTSVTSYDKGVCIKVRGRDLSSYRASVTSIFRLLNVIVETQGIVCRERR